MSGFMWLLVQVGFDVQQPIATSCDPELLKAKATEMNSGKPMKWLESEDGFSTDNPGWNSLQFGIDKVEVLE